MAGVNKCILVGNLGKDPEVRYTPSGAAVANFNLATSKTFNDKDGQRQEKTEWHKIVVWGKQAELCGQYLAKGRKVYIEGELTTRKYTDKQGVERYVTEINALGVTFLDSRGDAQGQGQGQSQGQRPAPSHGQPQGRGGRSQAQDLGYDYGPAPEDSDVPF